MPALAAAGFRLHEPDGAYYVMTDIAGLTSDDDVAFARRLIREPGVAAVPGSSFFSRPELGRTKLRFAFPKRLETLRRRGRAAGAAGDPRVAHLDSCVGRRRPTSGMPTWRARRSPLRPPRAAVVRGDGR